MHFPSIKWSKMNEHHKNFKASNTITIESNSQFVAIKNYVHNKTTLMLTISYAKEANNKKKKKLDKNTNNNM